MINIGIKIFAILKTTITNFTVLFSFKLVTTFRHIIQLIVILITNFILPIYTSRKKNLNYAFYSFSSNKI